MNSHSDSNPNEPPPTISEDRSNNDTDDDASNNNVTFDEHATLRKHPYLWAAVGVSQTFSTAIMFGWASLVPVLRSEGLDYTPTELSQIFTAGAVGNYLATLPFGFLLDWYGPKITGIVASLLYGLGLFLCSYDDVFYCFLFGFGLVGLARPGIQMPTLHLANLFVGSSGSGGAIYMSAQAAAFDAGTAVFALFHTFYFQFGIPSKTMFMVYMIVPLWTLITAICVWPHETIEKIETSNDAPLVESSPPTIGSPYFSPKHRQKLVLSVRQPQELQSESVVLRSQVNAPLSVVLSNVSFYALALWVCRWTGSLY
jgi:MFS family permease